MSAVMEMIPESTQDANMKLKKAHIKLMRHPETCLYAGVILMGESSVQVGIPTAYTDGLNKRYGKEFVMKLPMPELCGLVLHENLHVMLKHIPRHKDLMKKDSKLANIAMDFVVNDIIVELGKKDPALIQLPKGGLYDAKYHNWSVRQVWDDLMKQMQDGGGGGSGNKDGKAGGGSAVDGMQPLDEHDMTLSDELTDEEAEKLSEDISEAINQGSIMAGKFGAKVPRAIQRVNEPKVDWREELRDFANEATSGRDEFTFQRVNRRRMIDDLFLPSMHSEKILEAVVANDTSGSIDQKMLNMVGAEIASIAEICKPDVVRVLWWDTMVHGEQTFSENYQDIASLLKPMGGGGTRVSCVSDYVTKNSIEPTFMIIFTDGYVEHDVTWNVQCPVLWLLPPEHNVNFTPPVGRKVVIEN